MKNIASLALVAVLAGCGPTLGPDAAIQAGPLSSVYWNPANWDWGSGAQVMAAAPQPAFVPQPIFLPNYQYSTLPPRVICTRNLNTVICQ